MGHNHLNQITTKALCKSILLNLVFLIFELVVGLISGSLALISDAIHMVGDVVALTVSLIAHLLSVSSEAKGKSTIKFEIGGAIINGIGLVIAAVFIAMEGIRRIDLGLLPVVSWPILLAGMLGFAINIWSLLLLLKGSTHDLNIKGAIAHVQVDALGSLGAIVASIFVANGYPIADVVIAIGLSGFILFSGMKMLLEAFKKALSHEK